MGEYDDILQAAAKLKDKSSGKGEYDDLLAAAAALPQKPIPASEVHHVPPPEPTGVFARLKGKLSSGFDALNETAVAGGKVIGRILSHPVDSLFNPDTAPPFRRSVERGIVHALPIPEAVAERLIGDTKTFDDSRRYLIGRPKDADVKFAPHVSGAEAETGGQALGTLLPNPLIRQGAGVAKTLLSRVPAKGIVAGAGKGIAQAVLGHELAAVPQAAASAAVNREPIGEAVRQVATDPVALTIAGTAGGLGGAARGKAAAIRDPRALSGRTLKSIESGGGKIRAAGPNPIVGGTYDDPDLERRPYGRAGVNQQADQAQLRVNAHNEQKLTNARDQFGNEQETILQAHKNSRYDFVPLHSKFAEIEKDITASNGKVTDPSLKSALDHLRAVTTVPASRPGLGLTGPGGTVEDLIKAQRMVKARAEYGAPSTVENRPYRLLDGLLAGEGERIDPRLGPLRQKYGQTMESLKAANGYLYGAKRAEVTPTAAQQRGASGRLGRIGDETQAATGAAERQLGEFRNLDPAYEREVGLVEAKKNLERLRYGEPETSAPIEKGMGAAAGRAARRGIMAHVGSAVGATLGPVGRLAGTAIGAGTAHLFDNPLANQLRLTLPAADAVGKSLTGSTAPAAENIISRARRQRRERDKENARILRGEAQ